MITERSINELRDLIEVDEIVGRYVDLKKRGTSLTGCCPFHNEKTPSFHVNTVKGIYKCFGCGKGGDAIRFVMEKENTTFIDAIRMIADWKNFTLVEEEQTQEQVKAVEDFNSMVELNKRVADKYQTSLLELSAYHPAVVDIIENRMLNNDSIIDFQLGFAPEEWKFISASLVDKGQMKVSEELGLITVKNDNYYDSFRNRIIFPIHDEKGNVIGFGGRKIEDNKKENPKYLNSKESRVYKKERALYGIYQAGRSIRQMGYAIGVEGYYDVISCHQSGATNTVAPCGTSWTDGQVRLLKRFTSNIVLMSDGDSAGHKSTLRAINLFLEAGFKVEVCELPEGEDPDSFTRSLEKFPEIAEEEEAEV